MPPVAVRVCVYGTFSVALGSDPVSVSVGTGSTVTVMGDVTVPWGKFESIAFTVTETEPAVVGVPVMVQFAPGARPVGSVPDVMVQL